MEYRALGKTGIPVSVMAFGCGPISGWMEELDPNEQCVVIQRAIDLGINWFDTAAGYGDGKSEASLGAALHRLGHPPGIHIATKVRYLAEHLADIRGHTRASVEASLKRLGMGRITLLQLHNSIFASSPAARSWENLRAPTPSRRSSSLWPFTSETQSAPPRWPASSPRAAPCMPLPFISSLTTRA